MTRYCSGLERRLHKKALKDWEYEPFQVQYELISGYTPDFVKEGIWIEAKGFFRPGDQRKYIAVQEQYPDIEIVFIFSDPDKPVRRGAKMTMGRWCEVKGFRYFTEESVENGVF